MQQLSPLPRVAEYLRSTGALPFNFKPSALSSGSRDALGGGTGADEQREHLLASPELQGFKDGGAGEVNHVTGIPQIADQLTEAGTVVEDILTRHQKGCRQEILRRAISARSPLLGIFLYVQSAALRRLPAAPAIDLLRGLHCKSSLTLPPVH